ncbi:efflux RND transporter periplasmic adaptor subunit [Aestuariibacter halophilus]|uniref:Efflux RND transporter periplasmic adaptor subunit n=1 Tax=Fluctibacter halophilus TaxID=226011 RepID=A0ABS8G3B6_9ALTE|nr:efflux RND transporter periplasmic adaptor subunit [Aestuariibacter halophilus]MCC2615025.1 efflux RND transporter periplasmic adaptor subunit [Aestuariibacter halophilus]
MKRLSFLLLLSIASANALASPGAHGPNGEHLSDQPRHNSQGLGRQADGAVVLPMADQAVLNIRTQFVRPTRTHKTATLPGVVHPHPAGHAVVQSSSDGRYEAPSQGVLSTGATVNAGQVLGYVRYQDTAYELASQTSELLVVRNDITQTRRDLERLKSLGELASKQTVEQLETRLKSLTEQEAALQQSLETPQTLVAPIDGIVINHDVRNGQWVETGHTLFEILAPDLRQIDAVVQGSEGLDAFATATLKEVPGTRLTYMGYSPRLNAGMVSLHFAYDGAQPSAPALLVDQPVTVVASLDEEIEGLVLPARAVVTNSAGVPVVWIKVSAQRFIPQMIRYNTLDAGRVLITHGLGADNRVVVDGADLLNQIR